MAHSQDATNSVLRSLESQGLGWQVASPHLFLRLRAPVNISCLCLPVYECPPYVFQVTSTLAVSSRKPGPRMAACEPSRSFVCTRMLFTCSYMIDPEFTIDRSTRQGMNMTNTGTERRGEARRPTSPAPASVHEFSLPLLRRNLF